MVFIFHAVWGRALLARATTVRPWIYHGHRPRAHIEVVKEFVKSVIRQILYLRLITRKVFITHLVNILVPGD